MASHCTAEDQSPLKVKLGEVWRILKMLSSAFWMLLWVFVAACSTLCRVQVVPLKRGVAQGGCEILKDE